MERKIKKLIAEDKLQEAIELLLEYVQDEKELVDEIILLSGRFAYIQRQMRAKIISKAEMEIELNALRKNILTLVNMVDWENKRDDTQTEFVKFKQAFTYSWTKIVVVRFLVENQNTSPGFIISEIQKNTNLRNRKFLVDFLNEMLLNELISKKTENRRAYWSLNSKGIAYFAQFLDS